MLVPLSGVKRSPIVLLTSHQYRLHVDSQVCGGDGLSTGWLGNLLLYVHTLGSSDEVFGTREGLLIIIGMEEVGVQLQRRALL